MLFIFHCHSPICPTGMATANVLWKVTSAVTSNFSAAVLLFNSSISAHLSRNAQQPTRIHLPATLNVQVFNNKVVLNQNVTLSDEPAD